MQQRTPRVIIVERPVEVSADPPWWTYIGGPAGTGAVFGGIAWAYFWLRYPKLSSRMELGRWMGAGTLLGGLAGIIYLLAKVAVN